MKTKIYIDFEAFNSLGKRNSDPFAFSISTSKKKNITFIHDFNKHYSFEYMKTRSLNCIQKLTGITNIDEIQFVAFGAQLEREILVKWFGENVDIKDLQEGLQGGLSSLTPEYEVGVPYFDKYYDHFLKHISPYKIKKQNLTGDGAFAGMFGSYLLEPKSMKKVSFTRNEIKDVLKIMKRYSVDDVLRLVYMEENYNKVQVRSTYIGKLNKEIQLINKNKRVHETILNFLKLNPNMSIKQLEKSVKIKQNKIEALREKKKK